MIAHLVRKLVPTRARRKVACPRCHQVTRTETHLVIYCLVCGQPIPLPPAQGRAA
jgi:Zn finger protein HypA/HybF involved in hydrogenase expression